MGADFLIVGGGIAGASAGYFLSAVGRVILLEMEAAPGYHSTGRSAAVFTEYYGNSVIRTLTAASRAFYADPPPGFTRPLLRPRGTIALAPAGAEAQFAAALASGRTAPVPAHEISPAEVQRRCPMVRRTWYTRALLRPAVMDIDVDAVHQGFLRRIRAAGGQVIPSARVRQLDWRGGRWRAVTDAGEFAAPVVVNSAGAWADAIARLAGVRPAGLVPKRRTAILVDAPAGADVSPWPMITDVGETFYVKPESGRMLASPADATPMTPGDVRPDDLDIALAAERVQQATTLIIRSVRRAWAGLRSMVPDDTPVIGPDPVAPGFIWFAALSGYGVQTAPATGRLAAALAAGDPPSPDRGAADTTAIDLADIRPGRSY
jgi:D-arginine dehydrogenase